MGNIKEEYLRAIGVDMKRVVKVPSSELGLLITVLQQLKKKKFVGIPLHKP